jgi:hypothetical protein
VNGETSERKRSKLVRQVEHFGSDLPPRAASAKQWVDDVGSDDELARKGIGRSGQGVLIIVLGQDDNYLADANVDESLDSVLRDSTARDDDLGCRIASDLSNERLVLVAARVGIDVVQVNLPEAKRGEGAVSCIGVDRRPGGGPAMISKRRVDKRSA